MDAVLFVAARPGSTARRQPVNQPLPVPMAALWRVLYGSYSGAHGLRTVQSGPHMIKT